MARVEEQTDEEVFKQPQETGRTTFNEMARRTNNIIRIIMDTNSQE